jgi:hypothetical protein
MPLYKNPDFRDLPGALATMFSRHAAASFFATPQWYDVLARFGLPPGIELRVYTDERPGSIAALLAAADRTGGRRGLTGVANYYSIEHDPLVASEPTPDAAISSILSAIDAERPRWEYLRFAELDPCDASYGGLVRGFRRSGLLVDCSRGAANWYEPTAGMTFADYLSARPSPLRNTWQRKRRSLNASGRLTTRFSSGPDGIDAAVQDYQMVYARSWKPAEPFPLFMPALIRTAANAGVLRLGIYYIDHLPAAAQFWIVSHHRAILYKLAHDRRFDNLSLGTLLTMEMIERVLEQDRPCEINFGRGDDRYKGMWVSQRRERWGISAANPLTLRGLRIGIEREAAKLYHRFRGDPTTPAAVGTL